MDPLSLLLGGTSLANLVSQYSNAADARRFAQAGRTDAFGNKVSYNDALNEWITQLTPTQQALVKAGEHEQLLGLTEDAGRNRNVRERAFERGRGAEEDYNAAQAGYRYDQPKSEGSIYNDLVSLITQARGTGDRADARLAGRQQMRQGGNLPIVYAGGNGASGGAGDKLAQIMLQARQGALQESQSREQAHENKYLPALQSFNQIAQGGGNAPIKYSDTPDKLSDMIGNMSKGGLDAFKAGGSATNDATGNMIKALAAIKSGNNQNKTGQPGYFGGSPETNQFLNPSTYGNRGYGQGDFGDFIF